MGQRSQIYFRCNTRDGKRILVARYFPWNYGTRMVSRARGVLEWLESNKVYPTLFYKGSDMITKLERIIDINFNYHDIVLSSDIIKEYQEGDFDDPKDIFIGQDNNDGQFIIDMKINWDKEDKNGNYPVKFKYAFLDSDTVRPMNGEAYMQWDYGVADIPWRERENVKDEIKFTERNIRYIDKHAELMTDKEVKEYIYYDYMKDMEIVQG